MYVLKFVYFDLYPHVHDSVMRKEAAKKMMTENMRPPKMLKRPMPAFLDFAFVDWDRTEVGALSVLVGFLR